MNDELPDEIFAGPDCQWNADPIEPCMTHYVRGDVARARRSEELAEANQTIEQANARCNHLEQSESELLAELDQLGEAVAEAKREIAAYDIRMGSDAKTIVELRQQIAAKDAALEAANGHIDATIDTMRANAKNPTDKYIEQRNRYLLSRLTAARSAKPERQEAGEA
jgi:septal ring factor EnvC (AmiA/AmiB activator)